MKALTYHGAKDVRVETVPDPKLLADDDIVLRVTATAICGSDLHIYRGKIPMVKDGDILGHEFMGIVEEVGSGVTRVRRGDRVVIPFVIACGSCFYCSKSLFAACETTNDGRGAILNKKSATSGAALFGYSHLYGGVPGGQAEFVRVPQADGTLVPVPGTGFSDETMASLLALTDVMSTGYHAAVSAGVEPGDTVAVVGDGAVGLSGVLSAKMLGAERIIVLGSTHEDRHQLAREWGATSMHEAFVSAATNAAWYEIGAFLVVAGMVLLIKRLPQPQGGGYSQAPQAAPAEV